MAPKAIRMVAEVDDKHRTTLLLPDDIPAGRSEIVIHLEEKKPRPPILDLRTLNIPW